MQVAVDTARIAGHRSQAGEGGQAVRRAECLQVAAGGSDELGVHPEPHAGHAVDHFGVRVLVKAGLDEGVHLGDLCVQGENPLGEPGHHHGCQFLPGQHDRLGVRRLDRSLSHRSSVADVVTSQPRFQSAGADTAYGRRCLVAGQQRDQAAALRGQSPFERREDLQELGVQSVGLPGAVTDQVGAASDLRTLTARRLDLVNDRIRQTNRLRAQLLEFFPALERALNLSKKGPVVLLTGYQAPAAIRRSGASRLGTWLKNCKVKNAAVLAETAVEAAKSQHTAPPGETLAGAMVARIAKGVLALNEEIAELDALIEARFNEHRHATVIRSLPGMGSLLGAEFIAATGGDMEAFGTADRLASFAGLSPVPRDSGRVSGNMRRPRRYHRGLLRALYLSAMASLRACSASQAYYGRKRNEGKGHKQALLALARRRANVLWAMLRDGTCYEVLPTVTAAA